MPAVPITSDEQYEKALEVLLRMDGMWQGVGQKEKYLLVTQAQYEALVEAKVVNPEDTNKEPQRGKNSRKRGKP